MGGGLRAELGHGTQPMFLGIQHQDARPTWVVQHNAGKELRFAITEEKAAVFLFVNAALTSKTHRGSVRIDLVHCDHVLVSTFLEDKAAPRGDFNSMLVVMKSAI